MIVRIVLRELIDERGITQTKLAEMTSLRPAVISNLCRGFVERICLTHIERIASALHITDINEIIRLEATV